MSDQQAGQILGMLHRWLGTQARQPESDTELLERFVCQRDESAFALLMNRHGLMVLNVCRRQLTSHHDIEDAFQTTFLILARQAGSIRKRASIGSWLHGVALRVTAQQRATAARQPLRDRRRFQQQSREPHFEIAVRELQDLLDEELQRLPEKYRIPLVLCYLEDQTHEEIARQLAWPVGTVKGRLARGRELLRGRLARRGLNLLAGSLATFFAVNTTSSAVPPSLATATLKTVGGIMSLPVATLSDHVMHSMALARLKSMSAVLLLLGLLGTGAGVMTHRQFAPESPKSPTPYSKSTHEATLAAKDEPPRTDLFGDPLPAGALMRLGTVRMRDRHMSVVFSPDGKTVISAGLDRIIRTWDPATGKEIRRTVLEATKPLLNGLRLSADGETVEGYADPKDETLYVWDAVTGKLRLSIPIGHTIPATALSADGKILAAEHRSEKTQMIHLWDTTSGKVRHRLV